MIIVAAVETETPTIDGAKSESVGIAIVFLLFLFIFFCAYFPSVLIVLPAILTQVRQTVLGGHRVDLDF